MGRRRGRGRAALDETMRAVRRRALTSCELSLGERDDARLAARATSMHVARGTGSRRK